MLRKGVLIVGKTHANRSYFVYPKCWVLPYIWKLFRAKRELLLWWGGGYLHYKNK